MEDLVLGIKPTGLVFIFIIQIYLGSAEVEMEIHPRQPKNYFFIQGG